MGSLVPDTTTFDYIFLTSPGFVVKAMLVTPPDQRSGESGTRGVGELLWT